MPRYFFNTRIGDELISDPDGEVLRDPDRAWEMARAMIRELLKTDGADGALLNATIEVIVDRGYNGLTTKEVAARAGLSNGALVHHYGTKADLIMAATSFIYDRAIEKGRAIARSDRARKDPLDAFIVDCMNVYFEWTFIAASEVLMVARI